MDKFFLNIKADVAITVKVDSFKSSTTCGNSATQFYAILRTGEFSIGSTLIIACKELTK
jgi:hypothetical protein